MTSKSKGVSPEARATLKGLEFVEYPEPMLRDASGCVLKPGMFHRASMLEIVRRCADYDALARTVEELRKENAQERHDRIHAQMSEERMRGERDQARSTLEKLASELQRTHPSILRMRGIVDAVTDTRERK
jgi:hypothetical protein